MTGLATHITALVLVKTRKVNKQCLKTSESLQHDAAMVETIHSGVGSNMVWFWQQCSPTLKLHMALKPKRKEPR